MKNKKIDWLVFTGGMSNLFYSVAYPIVHTVEEGGEHMLVYLYYYKERIKYLPNYKYNVKIYTWDELYNKKCKDKKLSFSDIYREATKVYNKYNLFY